MPRSFVQASSQSCCMLPLSGFIPRGFSLFDKLTGCKLFCMDCPLLFTSCPRDLNITSESTYSHSSMDERHVCIPFAANRVACGGLSEMAKESPELRYKPTIRHKPRQPTLANRVAHEDELRGQECVLPHN